MAVRGRRGRARRLVITADDLGMDPDTNEAILDLLREERVSASTLMTVAPGAEDAVTRLRGAGVPEPHLHVTLTGAREFAPWRPLAASSVPSLTTDAGDFHVSAARLERSGLHAEVVLEIAAQLTWMRARGLRPAAIDSHSGTLYGMRGRSYAADAVALCAENGLDLRVPRRLSRAIGAALGSGFRRAHAGAIALAAASGVRLPEAIITAWLPDRSVISYGQLRGSVLAQLRGLPPGTSELIMHPAPPEGASRLNPWAARKRVWELRLLRDAAFHRELRREGIRVVPAW